MTRFARYARWVLGINLLVILWGAFVRASGSGAGCGSHWPLCNGVVLPRAPAVATIIEFTHRATSGVALACVLVLVVAARRVFPPRAPARRAAQAAMLLIITEALVGAGLVLFEMVARNASVARGWWMSAHLVNTFLLLASLALTASFAGGAPPPRLRGSGITGVVGLLLLLFALVLGVSGAITALGDTLFPAASLREGLAQDLDASAHFFVRLRVWHPVLAIAFGATAALGTRWLAARAGDPAAMRFANACGALIVAQLTVGAANLFTLAPIALQLVHLLLADLVWIALVLCLCAASAANVVSAATAAPGARAARAARAARRAPDPA
ncbi:MAG TPA: COX15/CtaA family protein [Gemmatimonadaceae bacterium]|nr:COX15/CtaA family protein [Gemmatimonadaceae bacterium]